MQMASAESQWNAAEPSWRISINVYSFRLISRGWPLVVIGTFNNSSPRLYKIASCCTSSNSLEMEKDVSAWQSWEDLEDSGGLDGIAERFPHSCHSTAFRSCET